MNEALHSAGRGELHLRSVPRALEDSLESLYESTYSLPAYFDAFFPGPPRSAWHLASPAHLLEFRVEGSVVDVLNGVFHIEPQPLRTFCDDVFAALPSVDRIRFRNLPCNPAKTGLPFRLDRKVEDFVLPLAAVREEYLGTLGRSTRQNLPRYLRRIEREHSDYRFQTQERSSIDPPLVAAIIGLNRRHWSARGSVSGIDENYERRLQQLVKACGFVTALVFGETVVAGWVATRVGTHVYLHVTGYHDEHSHLHPGLAMSFLTIDSCIDRGASTVHFLWGDADYKRRLGARPVDLYFATVFRSSKTRYLHAGEEVAYWRTRIRASGSPLVAVPRRVRGKVRRVLLR